MFSRTRFSSDEWSRVAASPMAVYAAVSAADPGGLWIARDLKRVPSQIAAVTTFSYELSGITAFAPAIGRDGDAYLKVYGMGWRFAFCVTVACKLVPAETRDRTRW